MIEVAENLEVGRIGGKTTGRLLVLLLIAFPAVFSGIGDFKSESDYLYLCVRKPANPQGDDKLQAVGLTGEFSDLDEVVKVSNDQQIDKCDAEDERGQ